MAGATRVFKTRYVLGFSQILTHCLLPLCDYTSFIQRKYFTLVTYLLLVTLTSTRGNCYEPIRKTQD